MNQTNEAHTLQTYTSGGVHARTFLGYSSGNEAHNTKTPPADPSKRARGSVHTFERQGANVGDVKCQALSPQRDARPSYGVPSGPFSSTCQNETSSARSNTASEATELAGVGACGGGLTFAWPYFDRGMRVLGVGLHL